MEQVATGNCTEFRGATGADGGFRGYVNCGGRRLLAERVRPGHWQLTDVPPANVLDVQAGPDDLAALLQTRSGLVLERRAPGGATRLTEVQASETHARSGALAISDSGWRAVWASDEASGGTSVWEAVSSGDTVTTRRVATTEHNLSDVHLAQDFGTGDSSLTFSSSNGRTWNVEFATTSGTAPFEAPRAIRSSDSDTHPFLASDGASTVLAFLKNSVPTLCPKLSRTGDCDVAERGQRTLAGASYVSATGTGDGAVMAWTDNIGFAGDGSDVYAAGQISSGSFRFKISRTREYAYQQVLQVLARPRRAALVVYLGENGIQARALNRP